MAVVVVVMVVVVVVGSKVVATYMLQWMLGWGKCNFFAFYLASKGMTH
jgi:hypothetical protein